jgi:hypothetical protein
MAPATFNFNPVYAICKKGVTQMINRLIMSMLLIVFSILVSAMFYADQALTSVFHKDEWVQESVDKDLCDDTSCDGYITASTQGNSQSVSDLLASQDDAPIIFQPLILLLIGLIAIFFLRKSASDK